MPNELPPQNETLARLLEEAIANERSLSRTTQGTYDRSASQSKPAFATAVEELELIALTNLKSAYIELFSARNKAFSDSAEIKQFFDKLLGITHAGIFQADSIKLRTWNTTYTKYDFSDLPEALTSFYEEYFLRMNKPGNELENYSWASRSFDTELHPYSDGCGRLSRLHGSFFLIRANLPLPRFDSRASYYCAIGRSFNEFFEYVRHSSQL